MLSEEAVHHSSLSLLCSARRQAAADSRVFIYRYDYSDRRPTGDRHHHLHINYLQYTASAPASEWLVLLSRQSSLHR